jgi:hypothetical protein
LLWVRVPLLSTLNLLFLDYLNLPFNCLRDLFDKSINSILVYCCEEWGY